MRRSFGFRKCLLRWSRPRTAPVPLKSTTMAKFVRMNFLYQIHLLPPALQRRDTHSVLHLAELQMAARDTAMLGDKKSLWQDLSLILTT